MMKRSKNFKKHLMSFKLRNRWGRMWVICWCRILRSSSWMKLSIEGLKCRRLIWGHRERINLCSYNIDLQAFKVVKYSPNKCVVSPAPKTSNNDPPKLKNPASQTSSQPTLTSSAEGKRCTNAPSSKPLNPSSSINTSSKSLVRNFKICLSTCTQTSLRTVKSTNQITKLTNLTHPWSQKSHFGQSSFLITTLRVRTRRSHRSSRGSQEWKTGKGLRWG